MTIILLNRNVVVADVCIRSLNRNRINLHELKSANPSLLNLSGEVGISANFTRARTKSSGVGSGPVPLYQTEVVSS